jgi:hypothetical protein
MKIEKQSWEFSHLILKKKKNKTREMERSGSNISKVWLEPAFLNNLGHKIHGNIEADENKIAT